MNLVKFLIIGAILSALLGEFGKFPFGVSGGISLMDIFLGLSSIFFVIWKLGIEKKIRFPIPFILVILFWLICLVSLIFSANFTGGLYLLRFIIYSLAFLISFYLINDHIFELSYIYKFIVEIGVALAAIGVAQLLIYPDLKYLTDFGFDPHQFRLVSTFLDPNFIGAFLNICLIVLVGLYQKIGSKTFWIYCLFLIVGIILTFLRSAYLHVLIDIAIFGIIFNRKLLLILLIAPIILFLTIPRFAERIQGAMKIDTTASERIQSWQKGVTIFRQYPILGVGFNNLRDVSIQENLIKTFSPDGGHSGAGVDSSILVVAATTGLVGLIVYICYWIYLLYFFAASYLTTKKKNAALAFIMIIGLLINSQFINSLFFPPIMLIFYVLLGSTYGYIKKN